MTVPIKHRRFKRQIRWMLVLDIVGYVISPQNHHKILVTSDLHVPNAPRKKHVLDWIIWYRVQFWVWSNLGTSTPSSWGGPTSLTMLARFARGTHNHHWRVAELTPPRPRNVAASFPLFICSIGLSKSEDGLEVEGILQPSSNHWEIFRNHVEVIIKKIKKSKKWKRKDTTP